MDEEMIELVKEWVSDAIKEEKQVKFPKTFKFGHLMLRVGEINAERCKSLSDHHAWHAMEPLPPREYAKHAEKVEYHLDQTKFWDTAATILEEAEATTLGELLEDQ